MYPALAVLQALKGNETIDFTDDSGDLSSVNNQINDNEFLWVGSEKGMEVELIERQGRFTIGRRDNSRLRSNSILRACREDIL